MSRLRPSADGLKQLANYLLLACFGFGANIGSGIIYRGVFGIRFGLSVVLAYATGMVVGFVLTKLFAFNARNSGNMYREMVKFAAVSMVALAVTWSGSLLFFNVFNQYFRLYPAQHQQVAGSISLLGMPFINRELASHLGGTGIGFFANFFGHKLFTFRSTGTWNRLNRQSSPVRRA